MHTQIIKIHFEIRMRHSKMLRPDPNLFNSDPTTLRGGGGATNTPVPVDCRYPGPGR